MAPLMVPAGTGRVPKQNGTEQDRGRRYSAITGIILGVANVVDHGKNGKEDNQHHDHGGQGEKACHLGDGLAGRRGISAALGGGAVGLGIILMKLFK